MTLSRKKLVELHNRIDVIKDLRRLNGGSPISVWRNKPVITVGMWESMLSSNYRKALDYIPNGFTDFYVKQQFMASIMNQFNATELEVWEEDYLAYLAHIKNPVRGRELCAGCVLSPSDDPFGLRKIFANALNGTGCLQITSSGFSAARQRNVPQDKGSIERETEHEVRNEGPYPCIVFNRFACPYKTTTSPYNDNGLIALGEALSSIEAALIFASESADEMIDRRYRIDFDRCIIHLVGSENSIPIPFGILPSPRVITVTRILDIYRTLTNPEQLERLLFQYFSSENPESNLKHIRDTIVKMVMQYKDKIKVEDLRDARGRFLPDSEEEFSRIQKRSKYIAWPSAECCICKNDICHIQCSNCNVYMCKAHWLVHMEQKHKGIFLKFLPKY